MTVTVFDSLDLRSLVDRLESAARAQSPVVIGHREALYLATLVESAMTPTPPSHPTPQPRPLP